MDLAQAISTNPWGVYPLIVVTPFIQEDTAVVAAATASISGANPIACYALLVLGISLSDIGKYWLGRSAHLFAWTRRMAQRDEVRAAKERVLRHLGVTLLIARFVPGTRIPLYLAAGLFHAPFGRTAIIIVISAAVYAGIVFAVFQTLGAAMGDDARRNLPIVALSIVVLVMAVQFVRAALARRTPALRSRGRDHG